MEAMHQLPITLPLEAEASSEDDQEFHLLDTYGVGTRSPRYPVHDCCEFEEAESLRNLIFVQKEITDDEDSDEEDSDEGNSDGASDVDSSEDSEDDDDDTDDGEDSDDGSFDKEKNSQITKSNTTTQSSDNYSASEVRSPVGATAATLADAVGLPPEAAAAAVAVAEVANNVEAAAREIIEGTENSLLENDPETREQGTEEGSDQKVENDMKKDEQELTKTNSPKETSVAFIKTTSDKDKERAEKEEVMEISPLKIGPNEVAEDTTSNVPSFAEKHSLGPNIITENNSESIRDIQDALKAVTSDKNSPNKPLVNANTQEHQQSEQKHTNNEKEVEAGTQNNNQKVINKDTNGGKVSLNEEKKKKKKRRKQRELSRPNETLYHCPYNLDERDDDENTPLHVAIHARKLEHVRLLLQAGASVHRRCDGSAPIHTAISVGAIPCHSTFAYECVNLLAANDADLSLRDDSLHTPLYLSCMYNLPSVAALILSDHIGLQTLNLRSDRVGGRPLHAAAKFGIPLKQRGAMPSAMATDLRHRRPGAFHPHGHSNSVGHHNHNNKHGRQVSNGSRGKHGDDASITMDSRLGHNANNPTTTIAQLLLLTPGIDVDPQNNYGRTPLHVAASRGNWPVVRLLLNAGASTTIVDRRGFTPGGLAYKRGMPVPSDLVPVLGVLGTGIPASFPGGSILSTTESIPPGRDLIMDPNGKTLIICHELCSRHLTCPPISRNSMLNTDPPPENVRRLNVLLNNEVGILRCSEFEGCVWEGEARRASMADILKIHEYNYVEKISQICSELPDHPNAIATLDADTTISRWSFEAALRASGSVCDAVDRVMAGDFRNAFCAVRPPGHHAGPRGIVRCANDPEGSHGFCLLNNVAIGAAYARSMYRNDGIKKVAIIDFDVHHGNGTEAIIRNLMPNIEKASIRLPFAIGQMETPSYRPWLDETDINNVFFASTHGYGPRDQRVENLHPSQGGWFYPASGQTVVTDAILSPSSVENPSYADFLSTQTWTRMGEESVNNCCKIINMGLSLPTPSDIPGMQRVEVRDSYRKKILPHLMDFDPDIIFISAGFDAHKRDSMNFGYVGMVEDDYEWVTDQLVKVANVCCNGRIVSVLEGGYKIHGGIVSPFARSVASHVRALVDGGSSRELYDKQEGEWESQFERNMVNEKERKRRLKMDRSRNFILTEKRRHFSVGGGEMESQNNSNNAWNQDIDSMLKDPLRQNLPGASPAMNEQVDVEPNRKRRRQPIDYKELFEEMKKESYEEKKKI